MNRSFLYGIVIASLTWSISFFLYWTLTQSDDHQKNSSSPPGWSDSPLIPLNHKLNSELESNLLGDGKMDEKSRYFIMDKESRYRKEKKFRKISHKLIDELRPVFPEVPKGAAGEFFCLSLSLLSLALSSMFPGSCRKIFFETERIEETPIFRKCFQKFSGSV